MRCLACGTAFSVESPNIPKRFFKCPLCGERQEEKQPNPLAAIPITEEMVEVVAKAIHAAEGLGGVWEYIPLWRRDEYRSVARAAISAFLTEIQKEK